MVGERAAQHPHRQRLDELGALGHGQELTRLQQPALGVLPANERLDAVHLAGAEVELRLVVQHELVALEGQAQLLLHHERVRGVLLARGLVDDDAGGAVLALVHRGVRVLQQLLERLGVVGVEADAEARLDAQLHTLDHDLLGQLAAHAGEQRHGAGAVGGPGQHDAELVAAESRDGVVGAQGAVEALGDHLEQLVAGVVAEGVVDLLEVVEVDEHQGATLAAQAVLHRLAGDPPEQLAVGQAGERVVQGLVLVLGGVPAQSPRRPPGDQGEHRVQAEQAEPQVPDRAAGLGLHLGRDRVVRQVHLEHADRLAAGGSDHGLQHSHGRARRLLGVVDDLDVGAAGRGRPEGGVAGGDGAEHAAVVGERHAAGEAAQSQPRDRPVEQREVGGRPQPLELAVAEPRGEVGAGEGRPDRHLVDDGRLRAALVAPALERLVVVPAQQHGAEHRDRHEARGRVDDEQA